MKLLHFCVIGDQIFWIFHDKTCIIHSFFSRKRVKSEMLSLFLRNEKWKKIPFTLFESEKWKSRRLLATGHQEEWWSHLVSIFWSRGLLLFSQPNIFKIQNFVIFSRCTWWDGQVGHESLCLRWNKSRFKTRTFNQHSRKEENLESQY